MRSASLTPLRTLALRIALAASAAGLSGCPGRAPTPDLPDGPARDVASSPAAQDAFDGAVALARAGQWRDAERAFQLFSAEFPHDPLTVRAELWIARCRIALGERATARALLDELARRPDDRPTRDAALLYLAFVDGLDGRETNARSPVDTLLATDPTTEQLQRLVLPGDEALVLSLVAEARIRRGDVARAVSDLEIVAAYAEDDNLLLYAWDRATEVCERVMPLDDLTELHARGGLFLLAVTTGPLVHKRVERGDPDGAAVALRAGEDAMEQAGLTDRLHAARTTLAAHGASDRLPCYGVIFSLTGPDRRAGRAALGSVLLAERAFESASPATVAWIYDAEGSETRVRLALEDLRQRGCVAAIGPLEARLDAAGRAWAHAEGLPWISTSPSALPTGTEGAVRIQVSAEAEAARAVTWAIEERGARRFAVVRDATATDDAWLSDFAEAAERTVLAAGAEVVANVSVTSAPDALQESAEQATRGLVASSADAILVALPSDAAGTLAAWLARANIWPRSPSEPAGGRRTVTWVGSSFVPSDTVLRDAADYLEHAILPVWYLGDTAERHRAEFRFRFVSTFGREPSSLEAFAFDAASWVQHRITATAATTPARFLEQMRAPSTWEGVTGRVAFDADGNPAWAPSLVTIRDGAHVLLAP